MPACLFVPILLPSGVPCFCRGFTNQILEKWFGAIGTSAAGATKDLNLYLEQIGKIEQAEMVSEAKRACGRACGISEGTAACVARAVVLECGRVVLLALRCGESRFVKAPVHVNCTRLDGPLLARQPKSRRKV